MGTTGSSGSYNSAPNRTNLHIVFLVRRGRSICHIGNLNITTMMDYIAEFADEVTGTNTPISLTGGVWTPAVDEYNFI